MARHRKGNNFRDSQAAMSSQRERCFPGYDSRNPRFKQFNHGWRVNVVRSPSPPVGPIIESIAADSIMSTSGSASKEMSAGITDCEYIASYNWLDGKKPRIAVPGSPPAWTPPARTVSLREDSGEYFRDPNAARCPKHPMMPAVQAVLAENPELVSQNIDIFACTSTLGSLLRFVRRIDKPFRFLVEVVGNTVFFVRHENSPTELIPDVRGYGHTFPEAYTTWDRSVKGSASHQRLLRYKLAGFDCIVRFQCDGYLKGDLWSDMSARSASGPPSSDSREDDLSTIFSGVKLMQTLSGTEDRTASLEINRGGRRVPQEAVFELKTRSNKRRAELHVLQDELPRFWIAQIPNFMIAYHDRGKFETPEPQPVRDDVKAWEHDNQNDICRFSCLLRKIISSAKARSDGILEVRCKGLEALELRKQYEKGEHAVLPPELRAKWLEGHDATGGASLPSLDFSDDDSSQDFTACSAEGCGYCGRCSY